MRLDQIAHYLAEIHRTVKPGGHFYLKAWKVSTNPIEQIVIRESDYALDDWDLVYRRVPAVQERASSNSAEETTGIDALPARRLGCTGKRSNPCP